jgi:hypothetical protein
MFFNEMKDENVGDRFIMISNKKTSLCGFYNQRLEILDTNKLFLDLKFDLGPLKVITYGVR